jgi:hypothetical protein
VLLGGIACSSERRDVVDEGLRQTGHAHLRRHAAGRVAAHGSRPRRCGRRPPRSHCARLLRQHRSRFLRNARIAGSRRGFSVRAARLNPRSRRMKVAARRLLLIGRTVKARRRDFHLKLRTVERERASLFSALTSISPVAGWRESHREHLPSARPASESRLLIFLGTARCQTGGLSAYVLAFHNGFATQPSRRPHHQAAPRIASRCSRCFSRGPTNGARSAAAAS